MRAATLRSARQPQVLRGRADSIRRGDQVALLALGDADGTGIAGAVTGVRAGFDHTVGLVVANHVHVVPADHDVVIIRDPAPPGDRNGETNDGDPPRGASRRRPGGGPGPGPGGGPGGGGAVHGDADHARPPGATATPATGLCAKATT